MRATHCNAPYTSTVYAVSTMIVNRPSPPAYTILKRQLCEVVGTLPVEVLSCSR